MYRMKRFIFFFIWVFLLYGCGTTTQQQVKSAQELKYKKILVMPFTEGTEAQRSLAYDTFVQELSSFPEIQILGKGQVNAQFIQDLDIPHPESYGAIDFANNLQGNNRRKKIEEKFSVDGIVFGSFFIDKEEVALYIQMMDMETGGLTLSFSKETTMKNKDDQEAIKSLAKTCAQKVIEHIKDNVIITRFYRYW